jgi:hypothetical protein
MDSRLFRRQEERHESRVDLEKVRIDDFTYEEYEYRLLGPEISAEELANKEFDRRIGE